jgi:arginase
MRGSHHRGCALALDVVGAGFARGQRKPGVERSLTRLLALGLAERLPPRTRLLHLDDAPRWTQPGQYLGQLARLLGERALTTGDTCLPLVIGGDHTIVCATMTATLRRHGDAGLLWFDAHADFNNVDTSLTGNLHGMPVHGLVYGGSRTFGSLPDFGWLGDGRLKPGRIAMIGLRDIDPEEQVLLDRAGILRVDMTAVNREGMASAVSRCLDHLGRDRPLHVSVDLDSLDPGVFPATGCLAPEGMTFDQLLAGVKLAFQQADVCAVDIVEYNPELDDEAATCGHLVLTLIDGLVAAAREPEALATVRGVRNAVPSTSSARVSARDPCETRGAGRGR